MRSDLKPLRSKSCCVERALMRATVEDYRSPVRRVYGVRLGHRLPYHGRSGRKQKRAMVGLAK